MYILSIEEAISFQGIKDNAFSHFLSTGFQNIHLKLKTEIIILSLQKKKYTLNIIEYCLHKCLKVPLFFHKNISEWRMKAFAKLIC